jgi:hypothetical protein
MKLAVIGTFYRRHENTFPLLHRVLIDSVRKPDEFWLMCEDEEDAQAVERALKELYELEVLDERQPANLQVITLETPRTGGAYDVIPYSHKINFALDASVADMFVYLDNDSRPSAEKYKVMAQELERKPEVGAVYCTQKRTGFAPMTCEAYGLVHDAFCVLNYTQVMHRRTEARWTLEMQFADPDLADALFWRSLHMEVGPFHPVGGPMIHDWHHIPSPAATLL